MTTTSTQKSNWKRKLIVTLLILSALIFGGTYAYFNFTYSEGSRAGMLIKVSKRGYIFKTYEGELNMGGVGNLPNTAQLNTIWNFSVANDAVGKKLHAFEGKKVSLHYKEKIKALPWAGETNYFVDDIVEIKD